MKTYKSGRNIIGGIIFLILAALALCGGMGIFEGISLWRIAVTVLLVFWFGDGIARRDWGSILFPIALGLIVWRKYLPDIGFEIHPWSVIMAAIFGTIGLGFIFGNTHKHIPEPRVDFSTGDDVLKDDTIGSSTTENTFTFSTSFASSVKYINSNDFKYARINCSFGESKVYFNEAEINSGEATIDVNDKFGSVELYVPKEWYVTNNTRVMFGDVTEKNRSMTSGAPRLNIVGNVAFGSVMVFYC